MAVLRRAQHPAACGHLVISDLMAYDSGQGAMGFARGGS